MNTKLDQDNFFYAYLDGKHHALKNKKRLLMYSGSVDPEYAYNSARRIYKNNEEIDEYVKGFLETTNEYRSAKRSSSSQ